MLAIDVDSMLLVRERAHVPAHVPADVPANAPANDPFISIEMYNNREKEKESV